MIAVYEVGPHPDDPDVTRYHKLDGPTDEMVERGASALALHEGYDPNMVPSQLWPAITRKYQEHARVMLTAALGRESK